MTLPAITSATCGKTTDDGSHLNKSRSSTGRYPGPSAGTFRRRFVAAITAAITAAVVALPALAQQPGPTSLVATGVLVGPVARRPFPCPLSCGA